MSIIKKKILNLSKILYFLFIILIQSYKIESGFFTLLSRRRKNLNCFSIGHRQVGGPNHQIIGEKKSFYVRFTSITFLKKQKLLKT